MSTTTAAATIDTTALDAFVGQLITELGAAINAGLVLIGDELGLYRAMAGAGPLSATELAQRTGTHERYVREWLSAQAAGGYVAYDPDSERFTLPPEHAFTLADDDSPAAFAGAFQLALSVLRDVPHVAERFRSGDGFGWHEHDHGLFEGTERFFRPGYAANLTSAWIPALDGVEAKLRAGALVADVGCGHGASTVLMAEAYPASRFVGFDYHEASVATARARAEEAGVGDRVRFVVAPAAGYPGDGFDLVTMFDCLHDMGDPVAAAAHVRRTLAPDGTWMVVEPRAGDRLEENLTPVGRLFYCASTLACTPASLAQDGKAAFGAQAGESRICGAIRAGGFSQVRRAAETPVNFVFEARA
jgi:SAM-dependent methyltransferase